MAENLDKKQIIKLFGLSFIIATFLLVIAVMPAEYGQDPTGVGEALGFTKLYLEEEKVAPVVEVPKHRTIKLDELGSKNIATPKEYDNPAPKEQLPFKRDEITVKIPAGKGIEVKVNMLKYGKLKYDWTSDKGDLFLDFHGEVKENNPPKEVFYESYTIAFSNNMAGTFTAPFEGKHGWYFKNNHKEEVTVKIHLEGEFERL
ncbi:hypothetical protein [Sediminitomix flava]|uniref:Uncharacterized protein n=1 Tax=Sediminitomix flava TaxID=379075 RepID=A0A315ZFA4_SEDFL|nr:hypothetical protein [Sediminitomix flava]PWJ43853.1 hypothetical protein BC781_101199 [Sediminitomix flava]